MDMSVVFLPPPTHPKPFFFNKYVALQLMRLERVSLFVCVEVPANTLGRRASFLKDLKGL
jgi:hypothetical protein